MPRRNVDAIGEIRLAQPCRMLHIQRLATFAVDVDIIQHMLDGPVFLDSDVIRTDSSRQTLDDPACRRVES
jgi:hypothetical protein